MTMRFAGPGLIALLLTACGPSEEPPVEQIVVREPGQAAASAVPDAGDEPADRIAAGKAAFVACVTCHSVEAGASSGIGPNLHGVAGREAGSLDGFAYSEALKNSGITWDAKELDAFIANPSAKVPGTTMVAGAVTDPDARAAIVDYLVSVGQ